MAKQEHRGKQVPQKKQKPSEGGDAFSYILRNLAIVAVFAILLFVIDRMNEKQGKLQEMYQEFQQLRQSGADQQRLQTLYNEIMEIQNDTSFLKKITRGYYWAVHDVAIKGSENVKDIKEKSSKPLTREDKLAMRVGTWNFIDYINKSTPEDAVVYLPEGDSATSNNSRFNYLYDPEWMEYFIYPRLCVAMGREEYNPGLVERVTHVVILNGKGYEKLRYDVPLDKRQQEGVLPIDLPTKDSTQ